MSILRTKLFIPTVSQLLVGRPSLINRIDPQKRLTLVSASAGFGKSTLIASWLKTQSESLGCWLSLDSADNDPIRFFSHLIATLQNQNRQIGTTVQADMLGNLSATNIWTILINDLIDAPQALVLVLDDYHLITNPQIHDGLEFLIDNQPSTFHLIITTRVDPPLPLARLRAKGLMTELRSTDLRFSFDETLEFFNEKLNFDIDQLDLEQLQTRTEGWVASLQLVGVALQGTEQTQHELIQSFSGSDRYVMDYLISDVLHQLPAEDQLFLTKTASLDRFCASLCDAVRQTSDSQSYIDRLEKANLFLFPLDNQRNWYRYHHLFADLLKVHGQQDTQELSEYHLRASRWFEQNDLIEEAVQHGFAADKIEHVIKLIARFAHRLFGQGKILLVYSWLDRLPQDLINQHAELFLVYGLSLFRVGRFDTLRDHLHQYPENLTIHQQGEYISLQAHVAYLDGEFTRGIELAKQSLSKLDPEKQVIQMPVINLMGWCYEMAGQMPKALGAYKKTVPMARAANSFTGTVASLGKMVLFHAQIGNHDQALDYYQQLTDFNNSIGQIEIALAGMAHIGHGLIKHDEPQIRKGIELCRQWGGLHIEMIRGYKCLLDIKRRQGEVDEVQKIKRELEQVIQTNNLPRWVYNIVDTQNYSQLLDPLTPREQEILEWLGRNFSVPQIAKELVVGESTIRSHIKKVYAKLDVHSRYEAVQTAKELKLI